MLMKVSLAAIVRHKLMTSLCILRAFQMPIDDP